MKSCLPLLLASVAVAGDLKVATKTLKNGLRLVAIHNPGSKSESIFTFLPMGLTSDGPGQTQWSHLVEHLVVRSNVGADVEHFNAETLPDHMRLDSYGTVDNWQQGLDHHRRWLEGVTFTEQRLKSEKPNVIQEAVTTARNSFTHKFALAAWAQASRHGRSDVAVIGDVMTARLEAIQRYRDERLVVLGRTVVCTVGGVDPAVALSTVANRLGEIRSPARPAAPVEIHPGSREITWDLDARHLLFTWPIPDAANEDYAALMVTAQLLSMRFFGDSQLKAKTGLTLAGVDLRTPEGMYFYVSASLKPGASSDDVRQLVLNHLGALRKDVAALAPAAFLGPQLGTSLTHVPDPAVMESSAPPGITPAMIEGNLGLQRGMAEFRYGPHLSALAERLSAVDAAKARRAAEQYLIAVRGSVYTIVPTSKSHGR
jgi:predicted Zn-dependent peptidase